ncbi:MAG: AAA family ATPase [Gammaproteobacteria bacterium]|nr:AAA family ATPase [Gammaproteobacteria bacterium]
MYINHFGLSDYPFRITPDTDYLYMSAAHSRAKAYMEYAIFNREGFVVITGEIGSGKTTLIKKLLSEIDENVLVAKLFQTQLDEVELLQAILVEFGLNPFSARKVELLNMLNQFLVNSYLDGKQILLIIDDAQNLSKRVLEEITMLSAVETQKEKILHVILVGQPELNHKLESPDMEQLLQRVSLRYHVRPLTFEEIQGYVEHRLSVAGCKKKLFPPNLYEVIFEYTGGIPRLINTLCDTALTCAYADNLTEISQSDLDGALKELQWKKYSESYRDHKHEQLHNQEYLYNDINTLGKENINHADIRNLINGAYGPIASRALVEISKQLKRIADHLDEPKPVTQKKK